MIPELHSTGIHLVHLVNIMCETENDSEEV